MMVSFKKKRWKNNLDRSNNETIVFQKLTKKNTNERLHSRPKERYFLLIKRNYLSWTNDYIEPTFFNAFTERSFSEKTNEIDGKWTIILREKKTKTIFEHLKKTNTYDK